MALDSSNMVAGHVIAYTDPLQYYQLLTGVMVDQNVTFAGPKTIYNGVGCRAYRDSNQSIPDATATAIAFNLESFDTDTMHDLVVATTRLTIRTAGIYGIIGTARWAANATGIRQLDILLGGATIIGTTTLPAIASVTLGMQVSALYSLAVNDYVELSVTQTSTGSLNVVVDANTSPNLMAVKLG